MKLLTLMTLVAAGGALMGSPAHAGSVSIKSLVFAGSGCLPPSGLSGSLTDPDKDGLPNRLNLVFANYVAKLGPGSSILQHRQFCNLNLSLDVPKGWQFTVKNVRYQGFAGLPVRVRGVQQTDYQFPFATKSATLKLVLKGTLLDRFQHDDQLKPEERIWSPCHLATPLNLRTQILLQGPENRSAFLRASKQSYGLPWRRCR